MALLAGGMIFTSCTKTFTITVNSNNDEWGTVTGGGTYNDQATATLTATPKDGYEFEKWQDGVKQNPRTISVTANETYTAYFKVAAPGVKVTFKGSSWDAGDYAGSFYSGTMQDGSPYSGWVVSAAQTAGSDFPTCDVAMLSGKNTGTFSGTADESNGGLSQNNSNFNYIEYYETGALTDGTYNYGDWWAKTATVNVTAFDATSLKMSANVDATMFDAREAFVNQAGVAAAPTADMKDAISNVTLTTSKSNVALKHGAKNLVAVK